MADSIWPELLRPWPTKVIQQYRKGRGGKQLSYVGWRTISDRLDRVLTPGGLVNPCRSVSDHGEGHVDDLWHS